MKKILYIASVIFMTVLLAGCSKDPVPTLSLDTSTAQAIVPAGGSTTFTVKSNVAWEITYQSADFSVNPAKSKGNQEVTVTALNANTGMTPRTVVLTIVAGTGETAPTQSVTISQAAANILTVDTSTISEIASKGGSTTFKLTSNLAWTITCPEAWISIEPSSGGLTTDQVVTVTALNRNTGDQSRPAELTITATGVEPQKVLVSQAPSPENLFSDQIIGEWHLTTWNSAPVSGFDVYMAFSADNKFEIYQQLEQMGYQKYTGTYLAEYDTLTGLYADSTPWGSPEGYTAVMSADENTMTLTSVSDTPEVSVYVRTAIPDAVKTGATPMRASATRSAKFAPWL